ncbi:AT-rich interactive domain-containing protein 5-like isoform X1 [Salvia splendens]|uniref:AT-rich interactive domain-containing protein 5-like isoform X1 n=2 Tax=Salvia splendens TaxID=180675 RepID=UPI001C2647BE|nr:AT-rich interactive domain-containing protein 5-like isoform X1 [Salvia splendens]XP_042012740.1 AT-rich interactive domain-containing protein 5-like isoform X1 [Salvia splendens]
MDDKDVEMHDAQKPDSGNEIKEADYKVFDFKSEFKEDDPPSAVIVAENASQNGNGDDDSNKLSNEANDQINDMSEMEAQTNHESQTTEPMSVEDVEPTGEQVDTESMNEEGISIEANSEVQTVPESGMKNGVVEESVANDALKEEIPVANDFESEIPVKNVDRNSNGYIAVEKSKESGENEESVKNAAKREMEGENVDSGGDFSDNDKLQTGLSSNEAPQVQTVTSVEVPQGGDKEVEDAANANEDKVVNDEPKEQDEEVLLAGCVTDGNARSVETITRLEGSDSSLLNKHEFATPNSTVRYFPTNMGSHSGEAGKTVYSQATLPLMADGDDGTPEDQAAFIRELECFYRERATDFKPPKFYGQPLNCLKLWRAVIRLGGYDRVTGSKLWRQVGESFHPPKTCTTVSWTFRIFYEKSLLEYERHKRQSGDLQLPVAMLHEPSGADSEGNGYQGSGPGRARRDAAARAMQGWHVQRLSDYGEVGEPVIKDKNINMVKREKNTKSIASLKQKRPNEVELPVKAIRTETSRQLVTSVVDVGPPADWVKINIRQTRDCFEVYALVPGLLREEVRVQSDPAGRLVITGQPEQADNPWGITPFKKVVSLPARINPLQTSAVVSLHGRLFVRVPFESNS